MEAPRYRIVLKGELMDGYDQETALQALGKVFGQPPEKLRGVLGGKPIPLRQELEQEKARQIQARLHSLGIKCVIQPIGTQAAAAPPRSAAPAAASASISLQETCPQCGHHLTATERCGNCGTVASEWKTTALESDPDEELLGIFVDSNADRYLPKFQRFHKSQGYVFTWHWPAFFVPVLWALYRRLWGWAAIMFVSMIVPPLLLVWPATANYIYFRHAKKNIARLRTAPTSAVATAGGTSAKAVWVTLGLLLVLAGASGMVLRKGIDSANFYAHAAERAREQVPDSKEGRRTLMALRMAAYSVHEWASSGKDLGTVSLDKLIVDLQKSEEEFLDGWGNPVRVSPTPDAFVVVSAGPDGTFGSSDDIPFDPSDQ